jgi:high-affinity Fe2+/Pb2+ permease
VRVARRREPLSGLVTLALLAILVAYIVSRGMRRMGMAMSKNRTIGLMVVFVLVVLMLWGQSME